MDRREEESRENREKRGRGREREREREREKGREGGREGGAGMPWSDFAPKADAPREAHLVAALFTACEEGDSERVYLVLKDCTKEG